MSGLEFKTYCLHRASIHHAASTSAFYRYDIDADYKSVINPFVNVSCADSHAFYALWKTRPDRRGILLSRRITSGLRALEALARPFCLSTLYRLSRARIDIIFVITYKKYTHGVFLPLQNLQATDKFAFKDNHMMKRNARSTRKITN